MGVCEFEAECTGPRAVTYKTPPRESPTSMGMARSPRATTSRARQRSDQPASQTKDYIRASSDFVLAANTCPQVPYNYLRGQAFYQLDTRVRRTVKFGEKDSTPGADFVRHSTSPTGRIRRNYQGNIRSATLTKRQFHHRLRRDCAEILFRRHLAPTASL